MTRAELSLLAFLAKSKPIRRYIQRWAMRYCARLLAKLGGPHQHSADLLLSLGESAGDGNTLVGRPVPRRPASMADPIVPQLVRRIPPRKETR